MQETPIFFPVAPSEFLQLIRSMVEDVVDTRISKEPKLPSALAEKTLLLPKEVCQVLRISKSTLYELVKEGRLTGFKIQRRRYFARSDVEKLMRRQYG